jgi:hypothetical protein
LIDYYWANFQASTDFRVGEAVKHLRTMNLPVVAMYKPSAERHREEQNTIDLLHDAGTHLLNDLPSYDYRTATDAVERIRVQEFMDGLIAAADGSRD